MPEKIAMPAQHGVRLYNNQCLFPPAQLACQEDDEGPIAPSERLRARICELRTLGTSDLALKHDELLTKQGILHHEL